MPTLPDKYREPLNVVRDSKGRVLFEAKAAANKSNWMLSVYAFAPGTSTHHAYLGRFERYFVIRVMAGKDTDRAERRKTLRTMCDLAAIQLGGVEYALREAIK